MVTKQTEEEKGPVREKQIFFFQSDNMKCIDYILKIHFNFFTFNSLHLHTEC